MLHLGCLVWYAALFWFFPLLLLLVSCVGQIRTSSTFLRSPRRSRRESLCPSTLSSVRLQVGLICPMTRKVCNLAHCGLAPLPSVQVEDEEPTSVAEEFACAMAKANKEKPAAKYLPLHAFVISFQVGSRSLPVHSVSRRCVLSVMRWLVLLPNTLTLAR